ncbi:hypothetical protein M422DRAFT_227028 [Sphaerobolus stellatus SS14]|uniref:Uncharacterized protein n=1 Tax=Sphaerobolus stellatus (strain SS14) TaxID=990650 RepID=A0A0C9URH0_SPHS4|nr:hypothetical protein M422DRAFT_227028 [Sphaerobolus stellatus SS14]
MDTGAMDLDTGANQPPLQTNADGFQDSIEGLSYNLSNVEQPEATTQPAREMYRQLPVRVHVRKPGRDSWMYVGRATVSHEVIGQTSRVVVRSATDKVLVTFGEQHSDLQAERRGNFVVVACVEPDGVLSWSLNAVNIADTLRLLASIELACYRSKQLFSDPMRYTNVRRKIERVIRDDRRKRHKRKREEETMISAFAQQKIT